LKALSDGGSSFATGYLLLALHSIGDPQSRETALELAQGLFPVLEAKSRSGSLSKDEAFFLSQMYAEGIGCQAEATEAARLLKLSEESHAEFKILPETRSREKLISLHLLLLEHSTSCSLCSSKNCKKMKVTSPPLPLPRLLLSSPGFPLSSADLLDRPKWTVSSVSPGQESAEDALPALLQCSLHHSTLPGFLLLSLLSLFLSLYLPIYFPFFSPLRYFLLGKDDTTQSVPHLASASPGRPHLALACR
jgi:hypothetical protein